MFKLLSDVKKFHDKGGLSYDYDPSCEPSSERDLQIELIEEELDELKKAYEEGDLVECADAITDLLYVVLGAYLRFGMWRHAAHLWAEVQKSNLTKVGAEEAENGKKKKGEDFSEPNIDRVLKSDPPDISRYYNR